MSDSEAKTDGTQAIRRAAAILRRVAQGPGGGMSLREVSEAMDLTRSTAHRILKCLVEERLIETVEPDRRYVIGGLAFELGLVAEGRQRDIMAWRGAVETLSQKTGATTYLIGRSGNEAVCLCKSEGSSVVRVIPVEVGQRRPLGVGAGATALLAATTDADAARVLDAIAPYLEAYPALGLEQIRRNLDFAKHGGIAESRGMVADGVYGLGMAIPNGSGPATLAISMAMHQSLATEPQIAACRQWLARVTSRQS